MSLETWDNEFTRPSNGKPPLESSPIHPEPENPVATSVMPEPQIVGRRSDRNLLEVLLKDKDDLFKARVMEIVALLGIYPSDPLFYVLISTGTLQALLERSPKELEYMFNAWSDRLFQGFQDMDKQIQDNIDAQSKAAIKIYQKDISKGVTDVLNKTAVKQAQRSLPTLIWAGSICTVLVLAGLLTGWIAGSAKTMNDLKVGGLDPSGLRRLTQKELATLTWANSSDGQYARNLLEWNKDLLANNGKECQAEARSLGVVLRLGSKEAIDGFCPLWVVAPSQRNFESSGKK